MISDGICKCPDTTYESYEDECPDCAEQCDLCEDSADNCITCSGERTPPPTCPIPPPTPKSAEVEDIPVGSAKLVTCADKCETCTEISSNCDVCGENRN